MMDGVVLERDGDGRSIIWFLKRFPRGKWARDTPVRLLLACLLWVLFLIKLGVGRGFLLSCFLRGDGGQFWLCRCLGATKALSHHYEAIIHSFFFLEKKIYIDRSVMAAGELENSLHMMMISYRALWHGSA